MTDAVTRELEQVVQLLKQQPERIDTVKQSLQARARKAADVRASDMLEDEADFFDNLPV